MSTTLPNLTYLQLDATNDPIFDPSQALVNGPAVAQAIETRLNLFLGEWWENLSLGLAVFQSMLGKPGTSRQQNANSLLIQQQIMTLAPYVTGVNSIEFDFVDGRFTYSCKVTTIYGIVIITNTPGQSATLSS